MSTEEQTEEVVQTQTLDLAPIRAYDAKVSKVLNEYVTHQDKGKPVYGYCIDGPTDTTGLAGAKVARRTVKTLRLAIETTRKDLKRPALEWGNAVDEEAKRLTDLIVQAEVPIDASIKAVEAEKREIKADALAARRALIDERFRALIAVGSTISLATVEELDDSDYEAVLAQETARFEEEEAERKRVADEAAEVKKAAEKVEANRLQAEAFEREKQESEYNEKLAADNKRRQDEADVKAEEERVKAAAERVEREAAEKKLAVAQAERDKLQAEKDEAERVEAERIAEKKRVEQERIDAECQKAADEAEAKRLEEARPVIERLQEFAEQLRIDVVIPPVGFDEELSNILATAAESVEGLAQRIEAGTYAAE